MENRDHLYSIAPIAFGLVEDLVGGADEAIRRRAVRGEDGDTKGSSHLLQWLALMCYIQALDTRP
jgi:hypothetical protein